MDYLTVAGSHRLRGRYGERGFIGVSYALMIFGLLAFTGLAIDVGYLHWMKRRAQSAADAAAMGALRELEAGSPLNIVLAGKNDSAYNGFVDGVNNTKVAIYNPPISGYHTGSTAAVEAIVQRNVPTYFMMLFGRNSVPISARAVGHTATTTGSIGGCIYALNPTAKSAFSINGTSINLKTECSTIVNSTDDDAFVMGSGAIYYLYKGAHVGVQGGWEFNGQAGLMDMTKNVPYGFPTSPNHNGLFEDPLKNVTAPKQETLPNATVRSPNSASFGKTNPPPNNEIPPGVYCGGMTINDTGGVPFKMSGVYVMAGGGFNVNSSAIVEGSNVTIYNTSGGAGWGCGGNAYAPITINGGSNVKMKAPTQKHSDELNLTGILFFQDRNIYDSRVNKIVGGANSYFDGALYFRNSPITFAGNNSTNGYLVVVADTVSINGTSTLGNNYSTLQAPNPFAPFATGGGLAE